MENDQMFWFQLNYSTVIIRNQTIPELGNWVNRTTMTSCSTTLVVFQHIDMIPRNSSSRLVQLVFTWSWASLNFKNFGISLPPLILASDIKINCLNFQFPSTTQINLVISRFREKSEVAVGLFCLCWEVVFLRGYRDERMGKMEWSISRYTDYSKGRKMMYD